jgi:hypothetical protein
MAGVPAKSAGSPLLFWFLPVANESLRNAAVRKSGGHMGPPGESGWREDARSPVGALGLAQFMPGTAAWIAQLYPADLGDAAPLDARWALRALVMYDLWLWERLTEFRDAGLHRWGATLSAYNGGLGNVRKDRQLARTVRFLDSGGVQRSPETGEQRERVYADPASAGERAALRGGPFYTERSERACDPAVSRWFCCVEHHSPPWRTAQPPSAKTANILAASSSFSGPATRRQPGSPCQRRRRLA